ncbi:unnamed protein product [Discosporangium mesarthrocarpum]
MRARRLIVVAGYIWWIPVAVGLTSPVWMQQRLGQRFGGGGRSSSVLFRSSRSWSRTMVIRCNRVGDVRSATSHRKRGRGRALRSSQRSGDVGGVRDVFVATDNRGKRWKQDGSDRSVANTPKLDIDGLVVQKDTSLTRGSMLKAAAFGLATIAAGSASVAADEGEGDLDDILVWSPKAEILKRAKIAGGGIAPANNRTYPVRFVTYLARFLINYDQGSRRLWDQMSRTIPLSYRKKG